MRQINKHSAIILITILLTACGGGGGGGGGSIVVPPPPPPPVTVVPDAVNDIFAQPPSADTNNDNGVVQISSENIRSAGSNIQEVRFTQTIEQGQTTEVKVMVGQNEFELTRFFPQRQDTQPYATDQDGNVALVNSEDVNTEFDFARILSIASRESSNQPVSVVFVDASRNPTPTTQASETKYQNSIVNPFRPFSLPNEAKVIYHGVIWRQKNENDAIQARNLEDEFAIFEMEVDFAQEQGNVNAKVQVNDENNVNHFGTFKGNRGNQNEANSFSGRLAIPSLEFFSDDIIGKFYGNNAQEVTAIGTSADAAIAWLGEKGELGDGGLENGTVSNSAAYSNRTTNATRSNNTRSTTACRDKSCTATRIFSRRASRARRNGNWCIWISQMGKRWRRRSHIYIRRKLNANYKNIKWSRSRSARGASEIIQIR